MWISLHYLFISTYDLHTTCSFSHGIFSPTIPSFYLFIYFFLPPFYVMHNLFIFYMGFLLQNTCVFLCIFFLIICLFIFTFHSSTCIQGWSVFFFFYTSHFLSRGFLLHFFIHFTRDFLHSASFTRIVSSHMWFFLKMFFNHTQHTVTS